jgi:hypothetical protein
MTTQYGRTTNRWVAFKIDDSAGTLRQIPVNSINGLELAYEEKDLTAFQDAIKGVLLGQPDFSCEISGPFDTTASTGSHTVLNGVNGLNTPLSLEVEVGMRHAWESGEPTFGVTSTAANGVLVSKYTVNPGDGTYTATIKMAAGSSAPAWATSAFT